VKTAEKRKSETQTTVAHFKSSQAARVDELTRATNSALDEEGIGGEAWDQMRKRIKTDFADAKAKGKVPGKISESKVCLLMYSFFFAHNLRPLFRSVPLLRTIRSTHQQNTKRPVSSSRLLRPSPSPNLSNSSQAIR
jgi:hypothetical protein